MTEFLPSHPTRQGLPAHCSAPPALEDPKHSTLIPRTHTHSMAFLETQLGGSQKGIPGVCVWRGESPVRQRLTFLMSCVFAAGLNGSCQPSRLLPSHPLWSTPAALEAALGHLHLQLLHIPKQMLRPGRKGGCLKGSERGASSFSRIGPALLVQLAFAIC